MTTGIASTATEAEGNHDLVYEEDYGDEFVWNFAPDDSAFAERFDTAEKALAYAEWWIAERGVPFPSDASSGRASSGGPLGSGGLGSYDHTHIGSAIHDDPPVLAGHLERYHGTAPADHDANVAMHIASHDQAAT